MFQNRDAAIKKLDSLLSELNVPKGNQRTTLADLGDDWIVNAVSLVEEPAVPMAKFLAIKSKKGDRTAGTQQPHDDRNAFGQRVTKSKAAPTKKGSHFVFSENPMGEKVHSFMSGLSEDTSKITRDEKRDLSGCRIKGV